MVKTDNNGGLSRVQSRGGSLKSFEQAAGATKNLRRFGQSIKRVVREVKEDSGTSEPRDVLVERHNRLSAAIRILNEAYQISLSTLVTLHNNYLRSKEEKNVFSRYSLMRVMIKEAVKIDSTWWALVDIPQQNRAENFTSYILRVCNTVDSVRIPLTSDANSFRESEKDKDGRVERVNEMTSKQVSDDNEAMSNTMYKLLKKYQAVRQIVKTLHGNYDSSKIYPIFPRYNLLKEMIKDVTHHPDYMEHRHESRIPPE